MVIDKNAMKLSICRKDCAKGERINDIILVWKSGKTPSKEHWITPKSNSLFYITATPFHTKRPLQGWVTPATNTTAPYKAGLFIWKGYEMKKYIPIDFDEKGKVVLGNAKNTPTPNGTIPAIFIPGGGDEGKQGLKSISISPTVTTEPAIDSLFPIYYEDLTEEQLQNHSVTKVVTYEGDTLLEGEFSITFTPTADWYASQDFVFGGKGEPVTMNTEASPSGRVQADTLLANGTTQETSTEYFSFTIVIQKASNN